MNELKYILEALLLSSSEPLSPEQMQELFEGQQRPTKSQLTEALECLETEYLPRSFELVHVAGGYRIQIKNTYSHWVARYLSEKPAKYSRALLETLAIIAWKQPVTRADIEELRGVSVSSHIMKTLLEREWIRVAGYKDVAGKPAVYTTTKEFLNYFNLKHLNELPSLEVST